MKKLNTALFLIALITFPLFAGEITLSWDDDSNDPEDLKGYTVYMDDEPFTEPTTSPEADRVIDVDLADVHENTEGLDLKDLYADEIYWIRTGTNYSVRIFNIPLGKSFYSVQTVEKTLLLRSENTTNEVTTVFPYPVEGVAISLEE